METRMTWEEMKEAYPNEWLLIVDWEDDGSGRLLSGIIERHSKEKSEVFCPPLLDKACAFKYTGESTFPGGFRSYAHRHGI